jgi:protein tyrosine/serine phosphatase
MTDDAQTPALIFCTAGKDRTGLVVALALSVAGVDEPTICEDYARSQDCFEAYVADERYGGIVERLNLDAAEFLGARAETMAKTFQFLRSRFGGVAGYLDSVGVDAGARDRLRRAITAK